MTQPSRETTAAPRAAPLACEDAELLISRRLDGELAEADRPALERHLAECAACRAAAAQWEAADAQAGASLRQWSAAPSKRSSLVSQPVARPFLRRRCLWMPLSLVASQAVALVGLIVYSAFFGEPVSAPRYVVLTCQPPAVLAETVPPAAAASSVPRPETVPAPECAAVPAPALAPDQTVLPPVSAVPPVAAGEFRETTLAIPQEAPPARPIDNVCMSVRLPAEGEAAEWAGQVFLAGDIAGGRGWIRIIPERGGVLELAQADLDTLEPLLRAFVRRFIAECARPEVRARLTRISRQSGAAER